MLSRCWGHWIAISLNSRSFCCCQHHNTHNTNLIDGPSDDAVKRGRGFWLQACGRSPACFKVVSPPAQSLRVHQKSVLNVLWCWTLDIAKELVQMTQHHAQHLAGWCCDHAGICTCGWDRLLVSRAQYLRRTKFVVLNLWAELRARFSLGTPATAASLSAIATVVVVTMSLSTAAAVGDGRIFHRHCRPASDANGAVERRHQGRYR